MSNVSGKFLPLCVAACALQMQAQTSPTGAGPQGGPPPQGSRQVRQLVTEQLAPNVYWLKNAGFCVFLVGDKGVVVVDTGTSPATGRQILDAVAKVTPKPVDTVILTHADGDHIGGLPAFPAGVTIIAQENTRTLMQNQPAHAEGGPGADSAPPAPPRLPTRTVASREEVTLDGIRMQLLHWAPAHTSGDLVVYLPKDKLVLAGDVVVGDQHNLPLIHENEAGTSKGWVESVQGMLALDANRFVIGHEAVVGREAIEGQLNAAIAERKKVKELYDKGTPLPEIEAAVGEPYPYSGRGPHFPPFSEVVYDELKAGTY